MLVNQEETYGLIKSCLVISSSTVCSSESLTKLEENTCLPRLLKGGDASCQFARRNETLIELVNDNTLFISNYQGVVKSHNESSVINGTYVIQLNNETIRIGEQEFTSSEVVTAHALPAVVSKIKNNTMKKLFQFSQYYALPPCYGDATQKAWIFHQFKFQHIGTGTALTKTLKEDQLLNYIA
ncbi:uncharacterized protein LOC118754615 [Rhagoletis pomonella]|uniref:uncharacterized protein LOC118754615 n=1 Tax=Rhagoletis pomonella TaxID=28610 RepID=UPI0017875F9B|nr:uncharacterized protein LOC118754615 [Rhagoletis pomonella]